MIATSQKSRPRFALAHDYFTQSGGAERVALTLAQVLKVREIATALSEPDSTFPEVGQFNLKNSFLNKIPAFRRDPRLAFPMLPLAWLLRRREEAQIVVASSSGWAHAIRVRKDAKKVVYCHNPPRWLYQPEDYLQNQSRFVKVVLATVRPVLLHLDRAAASSADLYLANSSSVAERIRRAYGREAEIVFPPVSFEANASQDAVPGLADEFFFTIARGRGYKGTAKLVEAFERLPDRTLVIAGSSSLARSLPPNIVSLGHVSDAQLRWLYSKSRALISVSHEDFGLTPLEANAAGTPVLVLAAGGFLDSTEEGVSGAFIKDDSVDSIIEAVCAFRDDWDQEKVIAHAAKFSTAAFEVRLGKILATLHS
ncbi:glycosyltransferase [Curtobacterium citreum]|uniref:glycosyltransferase n=1 Tax=Curtobacterium citreum TaxID=2036 RepID=UPI002549C6D2|nr:glycosyltransferase [Curtobacterium citreum]MDK8173673.1 glycosyltransferase [Curtobacterium citreum]